MNLDRLKEAEATFLQQYPLGFDDPGLADLRKRHNVNRLTDLARDELARDRFSEPGAIVQTCERIISRSSLVSRFEKPPFRRFIESLDKPGREAFAAMVSARLYGRRKQQGFGDLVQCLAEVGLSKWAVISAIPFYHAPAQEVFVKPTTAKKIIRQLEINDLVYDPRPDWAFYQGYRKLLREIKAQVPDVRAPNFAALSGFMMMSL